MTGRTYSFEFFPPRTPAGRDRLRTIWQQLGLLKPKFFSVTFGAGGSTQAGTLDTVLEIRRDGFEAAPHISCVASIRAFGLDVVTALCEKLLAAGAPGLHFYTLNQAALSTEIWQRLGLAARS